MMVMMMMTYWPDFIMKLRSVDSFHTQFFLLRQSIPTQQKYGLASELPYESTRHKNRNLIVDVGTSSKSDFLVPPISTNYHWFIPRMQAEQTTTASVGNTPGQNCSGDIRR